MFKIIFIFLISLGTQAQVPYIFGTGDKISSSKINDNFSALFEATQFPTHSAQISASGIVSREKGEFINGNCSLTGNGYFCPFNKTYDPELIPTCLAQSNTIGLNNAVSTIASGFSVSTHNASAHGYTHRADSSVICHGI